MRYLLCPKQYRAERCIENSFSDGVSAILSGNSQAGKTTIAKRLIKNADRTRIYAAYVPGSFTKVYGNVELAFSAALGLPVESYFMSFHNIERAVRDLIGGRDFWLIFDDADVHFGGGAEQRNASISLMGALIGRFPCVKLLFVGRIDILNGALSSIVSNESRCITIDAWQYDQSSRVFITKIGGAYGFKPSQLTDDYFIKGLLDKSHGASGAIIKIFQTLARHPHYKAHSYLPAECLHNLWRF
ncbi:ATP-binding protein [Pseudomonas fortuita]|uniref:ATP-binding protein n=1 Tax=Pseudomonas fortuita TaxID=3233375 RepID=UPI003DA18205